MSGNRLVVAAVMGFAALVAGFLWGRANVWKESVVEIEEVHAPERQRPGFVGEGVAAQRAARAAASGDLMTLAELGRSVEERGLLDAGIAQLDYSEAERRIDELRAEPPSQARQRLLRLLWRHLADLDPQAAHAKADGLRAPAERQSAISAVTQAWSQSNPEGLLQWLDGPGEALRTGPSAYFTMALGQLAEQGKIDRLTEIYEGLPAGRDRTNALGVLARALALHDPARFEALLSTLEDSQQRGIAITGLVSSLAVQDPAAALELAAQMDQGARGSGVMIAAMGWLSSGGLDEALAWARARPGDAVADQVMVHAVRHIAPHDPPRAFEMVSEIADERQRNARLGSLISSPNSDPADWRPLVESLPPGEMRTIAIGSLATRLAREDRAEAEAYLASVPGLSDQERSNLQTRLQRTTTSTPILFSP